MTTEPTESNEDNVGEPPPSPRNDGSQDDGGDSSTTCMICMEEWTIGTDHRLCCLKCGHLFGRSCIERWIKEKGANSKCPSCQKPTRKSDLRDLWCKSIKAIDCTSLLTIQKDLDNERKLRKTDSALLFHQNLKIEMLESEIIKLKKNLVDSNKRIERYESFMDKFHKLKAQRMNNTGSEDTNMIEIPEINAEDVIEIEVVPRELKGKFHFVEKIDACATGGCKSFALSPITAIILIAQPAPQEHRFIFGGFGLRKYSSVDTNVSEFIPLHSKLITSMQLKPFGDLVITSSQDRRVLLTSISNNTCIQSYRCDHEPTCVSWSTNREQQFYVASGNCYVTLYDMRNTSEYIYQTPRRVAETRLLSIASTSGINGLNGLLVNDLKGCQFLEISDSSNYECGNIDRSIEHLTSHSLPFEGLMGTVDYNDKSGMALISTRRSPLMPNCSHSLVKLNKQLGEDGSSKVECQNIKTFVGGPPGEQPLLSHSRTLRHPTLDNCVLVGASDQASRGLKLWDSSDNTEYQTIKTDRYIRDMILYSPQNSNRHLLYALSDTSLNIYKWDYA